MLPQGEFRRLLLAKSDEKERILEKLFGTERYKLVEESLKRKRAAIGSELKELRSGVEGILAANEAGHDQGTGRAHRRAGPAPDEHEADLKLQTARQAEAQRDIMEAQALEGCFLERDEAAREVATLQAQKPAMEQAARRADLAARALNLADLEESITRTEKDHTDGSAIRRRW